MRHRRAGLVAAALAALMLATGCATVPTKGEIRRDSKEGPAAAGGGMVGVKAQSPRRNMNPQAIVNGFVEAMSDFGGYEVAREYLTPEAAAQWKPETRISVYDQSSTKAITPATKNVFRLRAPLVGTIDQRGSWSSAPRTSTVSFDFRVTQVDGQYRVASVPPGVFLGSNQLELRLEPFALYFANRERNMLVPDPIFLPRDLPAGQNATQLIQQLLKGPTSRLGNGAGTAAPPGTQVNVSVPVDNGTATVELSDVANGLSEGDRELLAAQIMWTLRPISTRVKITVGGTKLLGDTSPDTLQFSNFANFDPAVPVPQMKDLYGVSKGKVQRIPLDGSGPIGPSPLDDSALSLYTAESFAVNLRGSDGAIVTTVDGKPSVAVAPLETLDEDDKVDPVRTEGEVLRPSFDNQDNLWIVDRARSSAPRLRVRAKDGKVSDVRVNFLGNTPLSLRMAPDGVRALMVMRDKAGKNFVQTGTVNSNDAKQLQLGQFRKLELSLTDITDATWSQLGVLVAGKPRPDAARELWFVNTDGSQPRLVPGVANNFEAKTLASNSNLDTLPAVKDTDGRMHWQQKDLSWQTLEDPPVVVDPVYPG
ncbi:hypothetical protein Kfla_1626 [Kribbella flavida DSM 17836]|uniref:GerMN domain-containing protein n=1 Tax=Kribbella flavida (strain DSM 17836 / JCM 10339 / NBRC 14399) TaxID=479435 RepID=D2PMH7_KRIFD|nr:LpqB family beta-propeller domain-containing protein [Kribbella flavida]ADB30721.1 hypothetical protein Kfla_1626 [Kribbella flavida DSM 17836]